MALLVSGCSTSTAPVDTLPYFDSPEFTPQWLDEAPDGFHAIPAFTLTDQRGNPVTEADMTGHVTVANFFFSTCDGICPRTTDHLRLVDEAFAEDEPLLVLSHSVTPAKDTVEVLASYAEARDITSRRWHLLTGDRDLIYDLGRSAYFVEEDLGVDKSTDDFLHTENLVLVDQDRHLRGIYNGLNRRSVEQLVADARVLLER
ncbi:MAG: SCO family protein [Alphaproteobacteria bacterium]|nr:SCO family protein [Alphaproteobacteria bacterium]